MSSLNITIAEIKLLVILSYASIFGCLVITHLSITSAHQKDRLAATTAYFDCELQGTPNNCSRDEIERLVEDQILLFIAYVCMGFFPLVNLTYIVNWTAAKKRVLHYLWKIKKSKGDTPFLFNSCSGNPHPCAAEALPVNGVVVHP